MASWFDTVMGLGPVAFWRLDHFPSDTVMTDSSGNDHHGELYQDGQTTFGFPSPVETDPASLALAGQAGFILASELPSSLDLNSTWIAWGYNDGTGAKTLINRNQMWSLSTANVMGFSGANVAGTRVANVDLGYSKTLVSGTLPVGWYMIVRVRNDTVCQLYVNDQLVDQATDVPSGPLTYSGSHSSLYAVGESNGPTLGFFVSAGVDEAILFDYALSGSQIAAIYASAINATLLSGVSNVIPTGILDSTDDPDPISFAFRHNWTNDLVERVSFLTSISKASRGQEENIQVRPKPRREIEIHQLLRDNSERTALRSKIWAHKNAKWFVPILEDREQIADQSSGATVFSISTEYKDYEVGGYFHVRELDAFGRIAKSENLEILSFTEDSLTTVTTLENDYAGIVEACPARRAILRVSSARGHTATVEDLVITASLLAEDEQAIPNRITPWTATLSYEGYEVFDESHWQSNNWSELPEYDLDRELEDVDFSSGVFGVESDTPGNQEAFTHRMWVKGRAENASFLGWFYGKAGSAKYFWVPSMQPDFEIISVDGDEITVGRTNYSDNFALAEARRDLAFVYNDGSMAFRRVTAFAAGDGEETLTLDTNAPTQTNLRSVSLLKFCRLDADTLEIAKRTDDLWIYAVRFRELLESPG